MAGPSSVVSVTAGASDFALINSPNLAEDHSPNPIEVFPHLKEKEGRNGYHGRKIDQDSHDHVFDKVCKSKKRAAYHFSSK